MQMELLDILLVGFAAFVAVGVLARMMNIAREREMDRFEEELRLSQERKKLEEMLAKKKAAAAEIANRQRELGQSEPDNPISSDADQSENEQASANSEGDTANQAA